MSDTSSQLSPDRSLESSKSSVAETPSGKGAGDENFPVGSFLLPRHLRPHVARYYEFARAIDDIADNPDLDADVKIERLEAFDDALCGRSGFDKAYEKAHNLRASLLATNVTTKHGSDLIKAFVMDAQRARYASWDDLLGYCDLSANPVGRYLLDLHGEDPAGYKYADALSTVLQIVNHLQDCGEDRRELDRVYIVGDWMEREGTSVEELDLSATTPAMRRVVDQMLDGCDVLMIDARQLPASLKSKHLAMESAIIVNLAERLIALLRAGDPLATRVALTKLDFGSAGIRGVVSGFFSAGKGVPV